MGLEGEVPDDPGCASRSARARIVREGGDITIVSWSAQVHVAADAAAALADAGIAADLLDLRTLFRRFREAVLASAARTGRLLVAHEAVRTGGFGAEIAATVAEETGARAVRRLGAPCCADRLRVHGRGRGARDRGAHRAGGPVA